MADETTRTQAPEGTTSPDVVASPERGRPVAPDAAAGIGESGGTAPSFAELVWAHFLWRHQLQGLGAASEGHELEVPLEDAYRRKLQAFEERNGRLVDAYWCRTEASAVAITCRDPKPFAKHVMRRTTTMRFHAATDWKTSRSPGIAMLLQDCQTLAIRAGEVLTGTSQWIATRWIMSVASFLLARCDAESPRLQDKSRTAAANRARAYAAPKLQTIESYYLKAAEKRARMVYVWGMVQGIIGFAVLIGLVGAYLAATSSPSLHDANAQQLAATVVAGAVGALISVLLRMDERRTSTFKIDAEIGGRAVRRLGLFRTTVGAILATAVFCALKAGLVQQIKLPSGTSAIYFYMVVAFLSGFSERWAQIVLGSAETVLAPAAPSAGTAGVPQTAASGNGAEPDDGA